MKNSIVSLLLVISIVFPFHAVQANEDISLGSLIELLIALEIISPEKADMARSFLPNDKASEELKPTTHDSSTAKARYQKMLSNLKSCGDGNDFYDGGGGIDALQLLGNRSDYYIVKYPDGSYLFKDLRDCREGTDTVINIERFMFIDGEQKIDGLVPNLVKPTESSSYSILSVTPSNKNLTISVVYEARPACDPYSSTQIFVIDMGDGKQVKADCKGVTNYTYSEPGEYVVSYMRDNETVATVRFLI